MPRLLTDSWDQDRHQSLKRWERGAQRAAWSRRESEAAAPPLPCRWRAAPDGPVVVRPARVLALFAGDLAVVRFSASGAQEDESSAGVRVLRAGVPWERWTPAILNAWRAGGPVPAPFRPRRRVPTPWVERALEWAPADQKAFLDRLREGGLLPPLVPVGPEAVAPWLRWDEMRARFLDFRADAQSS